MKAVGQSSRETSSAALKLFSEVKPQVVKSSSPRLIVRGQKLYLSASHEACAGINLSGNNWESWNYNHCLFVYWFQKQAQPCHTPTVLQRWSVKTVQSTCAVGLCDEGREHVFVHLEPVKLIDPIWILSSAAIFQDRHKQREMCLFLDPFRSVLSALVFRS